MSNDIDNTNHKVAFLIITTSNKRDTWVNIKDSYLYNITLKSSLLTIDKNKDKDNKYI